jgi:phospholipase C
VKSVKPIPHYTQTASSASDLAAYNQDLAAQNDSYSGSTSASLPIAIAADILTAGAATTAFALHCRKARTRGATTAV